MFAPVFRQRMEFERSPNLTPIQIRYFCDVNWWGRNSGHSMPSYTGKSILAEPTTDTGFAIIVVPWTTVARLVSTGVGGPHLFSFSSGQHYWGSSVTNFSGDSARPSLLHGNSLWAAPSSHHHRVVTVPTRRPSVQPSGSDLRFPLPPAPGVLQNRRRLLRSRLCRGRPLFPLEKQRIRHLPRQEIR